MEAVWQVSVNVMLVMMESFVTILWANAPMVIMSRVIPGQMVPEVLVNVLMVFDPVFSMNIGVPVSGK